MTETIITVTPDQPYKVEGDFSIATINSLEKQTKTVYLCSCGQSDKKPFCDGSHKNCVK